MDELGDRIKKYESAETQDFFMPLLPIVVRVDGRSFSKFTKGFKRPYDERLSKIMIELTKRLVDETNAVIGYTQSDEISLIIFSDNVKSSVYFNGRKDKILSSLSAVASVSFLYEAMKVWPEYIDKLNLVGRLPTFDCRAFNVPNKSEAMNSMVWREFAATKNAITMAASSVYSHKELQNKNGSEKQEMLFQKGINFNDYPTFFKRGTYVQRKTNIIQINENNVDKFAINEKARENLLKQKEIKRHSLEECNFPPFTKIKNKVEVMFNQAKIEYFEE